MRLARGGKDGAIDSAVVRLGLEGSSRSPKVEALEPLPGKSNYLIGSDRRSWVTDVPRFAKVAYRDVYPDVDLVVYGKQGELEYDLVVGPGGDPSRIRLDLSGAERVRLDDAGHLVLETPAGEVRQLKPRVYQDVAGSQREVAGSYALKGSSVTFQLADYDRTQPLVIDPVISYSTYLEAPSDGLDIGYGIAVDPDGNAYIVGSTRGQDFPTTSNAFQPTKLNGGPSFTEQAFVVKIDAAGTVLYSTYLGGSSGMTVAYAVATDAAGYAYVVGLTSSPTFPVRNPVQGLFGGGSPAWDGFLSKLDPTGSSLAFSTFIGGAAHEYATDVALDAAGNIYVAGQAVSATLMNTAPPQLKRVNLDGTIPGGNNWDAFVSKFIPNAAGLDVAYLTYLNGATNDLEPKIAVDGAGAVFVTGTTVSDPYDNRSRNPFPVSLLAFRSTRGFEEAFVTKLDAAGNTALFSTYLGGAGRDYGYDVALLPGCSVDCSAYVTGATSSTDFPTTAGAPWKTYTGGGPSHNGFVSKVNAYGTELEYSTYDGGTVVDYGIAVDAAGSAYIAGAGDAFNYDDAHCGGVKVTAGPVTLQEEDAHVLKLDPTGTAVAYCVFVGSSRTDRANALAIDALGGVYLTGHTTWENFYTTPGAFQPAQPDRNPGAFFAKISEFESDVARIQLDATAYEVQEDAGQAVVVVTRTGAINQAVSVSYSARGCRRRLNNCTHSGPTADEEEDFVLTSGTLTFGPDETALAFVVPIIDDSVVEPAEWFRVKLSSPTNAVLGFPNTANVTIHDDDGPSRTFVVKDRVLAAGPNWHAEENIPWLTLNHTDGVGPTTVTATVNTTNLAPGTYTGTIVVTGDTGDSPQLIEVTLTVTP
jgi:Calx-beta domain-containing protein/beta-propeller repeat-containing protein